MGWKVIFEDNNVAGFKSDQAGDLWFVQTIHDENSNYDAKGVNHISLRVDQLGDVDSVKDYLEKQKIIMLFDTPRHRPEFAASESETYYQIMFESPDKILFEVVFVGSREKLA
jgi:hypothetical protein